MRVFRVLRDSSKPSLLLWAAFVSVSRALKRVNAAILSLVQRMNEAAYYDLWG